MLGTWHMVWVVAGRGRSSGWPVSHARQSVEVPGQWWGMVGRPAGQTNTLGTLLWTCMAVGTGGSTSWLTCMLGTLTHGLGGGGSWRIDQQAARHSAPSLSGSGHRQVILPAGLACSALSRAAFAVEVPGGLVPGPTCKLGTLPPSLVGDGVWRVDLPTARHSAPGLGGGGHRRVVQLASCTLGTLLSSMGGGGLRLVDQLD